METWPTDLAEAKQALAALLAGVDVARLDDRQSKRAMQHVAAMETMCAAMKGRLALRVSETNAFVRAGHRSPAHLVAATTGTTVGEAAASLATAARMEHLPRAAEAFAKGKLSTAKARALAAAASAVPEAEDELLLKAPDEDAASFTKRCRRTIASVTDPAERQRAVHRERYLREWVDESDAWNLAARGTKADGARIMAAIKADADQVFRETRRAGTERSTPEAYRFDALVRIATRAPEWSTARATAPSAHVHVNVDAEALLATKALPGATCEIPGLGAIPVAEAKRLLGDAILTVLVKKGRDVTTVAHHGRTIPTHIRRAIEARDTECVVEGCTVREGLEGHHVVPWAESHETTVDGVRMVCRFDHQLVTYEGFTLEPLNDGSGQYRLVPPIEAAGPERGPP